MGVFGGQGMGEMNRGGVTSCPSYFYLKEVCAGTETDQKAGVGVRSKFSSNQILSLLFPAVKHAL